MEIEVLPDEVLRNKLKRFVYDIVGCSQEVHREKGPELTEYVYQDCLKLASDDAHIPPIVAQCEKFYLDTDTNKIYYF